MLAAALIASILVQPGWNMLSTRSFRVDPAGPPNHSVVVSWFGDRKNPFAGDGPGETVIDLYELTPKGGKSLASSTVVEEGVAVASATIRGLSAGANFEDKHGTYHRFFPIYFLSMTANGGQHDRTLVWWFDPKTMRPKEMLNVIYGDVKQLDEGKVIESSPVQYVSPSEIPKGIKPRRGYLKRTWTFNRKAFKFKAGAWRS